MRYISSTEAAKMLRAALRKAFPGVKFRVTSKYGIIVEWTDGPTDAALRKAFPGVNFRVTSKYGIIVEWTDGPTESQVEQITRNYGNEHFDGMIDMCFSSSSWLLPDGSITPANCRGTVGSMGIYEAYSYPRPEGAEEIVIYCSMPRLSRRYSRAAYENVIRHLSTVLNGFMAGEALEEIREDHSGAYLDSRWRTLDHRLEPADWHRSFYKDVGDGLAVTSF